jgi:hypothetical protein
MRGGIRLIYFAYDIDMDERELHRHGRAPGAVAAGSGWLANRRLVFSGEGGRCPVAVPSYGDRVYGVLYFAAAPEEIEALKTLRSPLSRRVTRVRTLPHNHIVFAVTFEAPPGMFVPEGPADQVYRDRMIEAAQRFEFPEEYISYLASILSTDGFAHTGQSGREEP